MIILGYFAGQYVLTPSEPKRPAPTQDQIGKRLQEEREARVREKEVALKAYSDLRSEKQLQAEPMIKPPAYRMGPPGVAPALVPNPDYRP
jgi:hypothetical protein